MIDGQGRAAGDTDEALVRRFQGALPGDTRAFEELVQRYQGLVLANCRYISGSAEDSQDLAQEVFVKLFFALDRFEARSRFRTWLHRVKTNHCLNHVRKRRGATFLSHDAPEIESDPAMQVEAAAELQQTARWEHRRIHRVLEAMSDSLRIPLILRDLDGLSYEEVSQALGIGLSATKMRIKRAREDFRRRYGAMGVTERGAALEKPIPGG